MPFVLRQIHALGKSPVAHEANVAALTIAAVKDEVIVGDYLEWSNPNARHGLGDDRWTKNIKRAKKFKSFEAAMDCWKAQSTLIPFRPDGRPNRPMTAYSVTVEEVP